MEARADGSHPGEDSYALCLRLRRRGRSRPGVARRSHGGSARVDIAAASFAAMSASRAVVEDLAQDSVAHYGVSTGFGAMASTSIPVQMRALLQSSRVRGHAASSGEEGEREVVRALMLLRLSTLTSGRTGARPEVARVYADLLNAGITPVVGEYGSLGCSGDLAPLAHCALAATGEGAVRDASGRLMDADRALSTAGHQRERGEPGRDPAGQRSRAATAGDVRAGAGRLLDPVRTPGARCGP